MEAIVSKLNVDKIDRDYSIDFTKGILVLAMIIYHSLNYSKTNSLFDNYLHFIGSGFIFMAGFLITNINRDKYKQETRTLYTKLILRGLKLAALFTILNILINLAVKQNYGDRLMGINIFIENAFSIFIKGNGKIAAFEILLSIGYLFLLSPLLLLGINKTKYFILIIAIVLTLICVVMPAFNIYSSNLVDITYGIFGMMFGQIPNQLIRSFFKRRQRFIVFFIIVYIAFAPFLKLPFFLFVLLSTLSTLSLFYLIGNVINKNGPLMFHIGRLGRYSLFAYIIQIAILQAVLRFSSSIFNQRPPFYIALLSTFILTVLSVILLDFWKKRSGLVGIIYKTIFA